MGKYVHKFDTQEAYDQERNSNYIEPWVSLIENVGINYNKSEEERLLSTPATIVALGNGEVSWNTTSGTTASYKKNDGEWTSMTASTAVPVVNGDRVMLRGTTSGFSVGTITCTAQFNLEGNALSIYWGDQFMEKLSSSAQEEMFKSLFQNNTTLISAKKFKLPTTTLEEECYSRMFQGCTSLLEAPELPATTLTMACYSNMFYGCTSLRWIKALFITAPDNSSNSKRWTYNWVYGVASEGTFIKNALAQWTTVGEHGVPEGWTIQTASE